MNTPRFLFMFGLFLLLTLICPAGNRMFTRKYSFWVSGFTWQSWLIPVSRSRGFLSPLLTDVVIGLLFINVTHYMPFILPDAPHRTDYSQSEGDKKKNYTLLSKISFQKNYQEINQKIIYVNTWDGVVPIIRAQGSCMKRMKKYIMDFLYRFLSFNKQLFQPLNLYW